MTLTREKRSRKVPAIMGTKSLGKLLSAKYKAKAKLELVSSKMRTAKAKEETV